MDSKEYILTQDIGIYSCKAALFSLEGETICTNRVDYAPDVVPDLSLIHIYFWTIWKLSPVRRAISRKLTSSFSYRSLIYCC